MHFLVSYLISFAESEIELTSILLIEIDIKKCHSVDVNPNTK